MGCVICNIDVLLMGKGIAYGGLPFPGIGCPPLNVAYMYLVWYNDWDNISIFVHLPRMFLFSDYRFEKRIGQIIMNLLYIRSTW